MEEIDVDQLPQDSLLRQLVIAAQTKPPIERKVREKSEGSARSDKIMTVRVATEPPKTKLHANSTRAKVMDFIQRQLEQPVPVESIEAEFKRPMRGFLQKLIVGGHLEANK